MSESLAASQRRLSADYTGGAPGVLVSGAVWLVAGLVAQRAGIATGFAALFFGGMLIQPLSVLVARGVFKAPKPSSPNPLERTAIESTVGLFAGLFIAWLLLKSAPWLVFPTVAVAIGARYFVFRTLYGDALYWALGATLLAIAAIGALGLALTGATVPIVVGAAEVVFGAAIVIRQRKA